MGAIRIGLRSPIQEVTICPSIQRPMDNPSGADGITATTPREPLFLADVSVHFLKSVSF